MLAVFGVGIGLIGLLIGQVTEVSGLSALGSIIQGGAFAVLAFGFLYLLVRTLPAKDKQLQDTIAGIVKEHHTAMSENVAAMTCLTESITKLRVHCAAVSGNPDQEDDID